MRKHVWVEGAPFNKWYLIVAKKAKGWQHCGVPTPGTRSRSASPNPIKKHLNPAGEVLCKALFLKKY